jgi:replication factor C subunit 3/5
MVAPPPKAPAPATDKSFLPWVEKYRPSSLSELISQNDIVSTSAYARSVRARFLAPSPPTVTKLIDVGRLPHLLFYGPPGTGKTSTILAIARKLYGPSFSSMVLEVGTFKHTHLPQTPLTPHPHLQLNASDDRGIDVVREQMKNFAGTRKLFSSGVKLIVLDEADAMTQDAQFALRRVIEKYTKNTRFCLIGNYVSKIIPALQSRCTRFRFAPLKREEIESRLRYIVDKEGLTARATEDGISAVLSLGGGDMRRILNILQATASGFPVIDAAAVYACTGSPHPADIRAALSVLLREDFSTAAAHISSLGVTKGLAMADIVSEIAKECARLRMPAAQHAQLLEKLADIEYRLAGGATEKIQSMALVAAFATMRESMAGAAHEELKRGADSLARDAVALEAKRTGGMVEG